ncbi:MAG: GtrA family protein [Frankiaceae bacterium]|nr:GtrA family protein [Frankiaceae bacterium]
MGGLSVAVDLGLLVLLVEVLDVPLAPATAVAFLTSVAVNFGLNRLLAGGSGLLGGQALRYGLLLVANLLLTVAVVTGAEGVGVPYVLAKGAVVLASTLWNYVLYRAWVFAPAG